MCETHKITNTNMQEGPKKIIKSQVELLKVFKLKDSAIGV